MTQEEIEKVKKLGSEIKKILPGFYGSIEFCLSGSKNDVKIAIKEMAIAKTK